MFRPELIRSTNDNVAGDEWDLVSRLGNPCSNAVDPYLTFVSEEQQQVGVQVKRAAPMLEHTLENLLSVMRSRAQVTSAFKWSAFWLSVFLWSDV